jgi:hypothetical protein
MRVVLFYATPKAVLVPALLQQICDVRRPQMRLPGSNRNTESKKVSFKEKNLNALPRLTGRQHC